MKTRIVADGEARKRKRIKTKKGIRSRGVSESCGQTLQHAFAFMARQQFLPLAPFLKSILESHLSVALRQRPVVYEYKD